MSWFNWLSGKSAWGPWSKPYYCGNGNFGQIRFRLSDNKVEKRSVFINFTQHEIDEACRAVMPKFPVPGGGPASPGREGGADA